MLHFIVPLSSPPFQSLRSFLQSQGISSTLWKKLKTEGLLIVNSYRADQTAILHPGDHVTAIYQSKTSVIPVDLPLKVLYEDEFLLIVDKPAGLLVHPVHQERDSTLANAVMFHYQMNQERLGFHPVIRLDRNTSGLVLIAKQAHIQHSLAANRKHAIKKFYQAIIHGSLLPDKGIINAPIARHPDSIIQRIVSPNGQPAITVYRTIKQFDAASLLELELLTGRTHQIRVHLSYLGHPILGDDLYGGLCTLIQRQALHAARLEFIHPVTGKELSFESLLPQDLDHLLSILSNSE